MTIDDMPAVANRAAEMAVVGAMMLDPALDDQKLTSDSFAFTDTRQVFSTILALREEGIPSDPLTVYTELQRRGWTEEFGGVDAVKELLATPQELANFDYYTRVVREMHVRREAVQTFRSMAVRAANLNSDLSTLRTDLGEFETTLASLDDEQAGNLFGSMTSPELAKGDFSSDYFFDGVLARFQPGLFGGPHKGLKTNLSIDLNISLATGGWWLQKFKANRKYRAALISGESGRAVIQETAKRIAKAKGIELEDITNAVWAFDLPTLGDPGSEAALERFIETWQLDLINIDPAYLCMPLGDDAGNLFKTGRLLRTLSRICDATGCTPLLNHHYRKAAPVGEVPELNWLAWAGFSEWGRQWILLNRRTPYDPSNGGSHKLWLVSGGSAGHAGQWGIDVEEGTPKTPGGRFWDVKVMLPSEAKASCATNNEQTRESKQEAARERRIERDLAAILKALAKSPDGDTASKLGDLCGMNAKRYWPAIREGKDRGLLLECEVTKGKGKHDGFKLNPTPPTKSDSVRQSESVGGLSDASHIRGAVGPSDLFEADPFEQEVA